jgi:hypothetical protein
MLGHSPISSTPISALPSARAHVSIADAVVMATLNTPLDDLAALVRDPRKRFVLAVEIVAVPIGV